jgi:hypothetical protein
MTQLSRRKATFMGNLKEARCSMGITCLGADLANNDREKLAEMGWTPSQNFVTEKDGKELRTQVIRTCGKELTTKRKVILYSADQSTAKPYLNIFTGKHMKPHEWPLPQLFEMFDAYDYKIPDILEKYRVFTDIALWNGGNLSLEQMIKRNTAFAEEDHQAKEEADRRAEEEAKNNKPQESVPVQSRH